MNAVDNDNKLGFFARLKQHHIYRLVVVYAVASWVLLQLANFLFPDFGLPITDVRYLIVALLLLFPVVLVIAWMLIEPKNPAQYTRWQKLHWKLGSILALVVLILVVISGAFIWRASEHFAERLAAEQAAAQAETKPASPAFDPPADSIVVLPFANLSNDPTQQYFSDGITEELTNALGQNTALRVIAWDTASSYRNPEQNPTAIGKALNVANLLHGSIAREGNQVRVFAELVNTVSGYQIWSDHYDDTLKNIFAVQDHISAAIANALQVKFAASEAAVTANPQAHDLVLKGLASSNLATAAGAEAALKDFEQAIALDPNYADAWAHLSGIYLVLTELSTLPLQKALPKLRAAARKALQLDPHNVSALVALGNADASDNHIAQAKIEFQQALALDPSNATAHMDYSNVLPLKPALAQEQEATMLDPKEVTAWNNLAATAQDLGDYPQMLSASQAMVPLSPHDIDAAFNLAFAYRHLHNDQDAVAAFDQVKPATALDTQLVDAGRLTYQSLLKPALRPQAQAALNTLRHAGLSPAAQSNLLQLYLVLGDTKPVLQMLAGNCARDPVGCNDLAINPVYQPLHGDPRFEKLAKQYTTMTLE